MAPKRRAASDPETEEQSKRYKVMEQSIDNTAEELVCPITSELPVDPVTAEDGHVYERRAIEAWIARPEELKSPTMNTPMGPRLFPAKQVRNIIEQMVRTGAISGPKADAWSAKLAGEEEVKEMRAKAEAGDAHAMCKMGNWYRHGKMGLAEDLEQAAGWWRRGHDLGDPSCTSGLASQYEFGEGVEQEEAYALHLHTAAACRGSAHACYNLGVSFADGDCGLRPNAREATRWYHAMESAEVDDTDEEYREEAATWLRENAVDL